MKYIDLTGINFCFFFFDNEMTEIFTNLYIAYFTIVMNYLFSLLISEDYNICGV